MGSGTVVTFYSFKGGTGRSMALANVAWILASSGYRVLAVDWDLEAPGLHRYFHPFLPDPELEETDGLIDLIWDLAHRTAADRASGATEVANWRPDYDDYRVRLAWRHFPGDGLVDFVPAGRQGPNYAELVNSLDWGFFYSQLGGRRHLDDFRQWMRSYDYALVDSRTGVSDSSGICTVQMPDRLVACTTLNRQSLAGAHAVVESVRSQRPDVEIYPVISRVELQEKEALDAARPRARRLLSPYLPAGIDPTRYWTETEVLYRTYYAYEEVLATFGDRTGIDRSDSDLLAAFERLTRRVSGDPDAAMTELPERLRRATLDRYLDRGAAPPEERDDWEPEPQTRRGLLVSRPGIVALVALVVIAGLALAWWSLRDGQPSFSIGEEVVFLDGAGPFSLASGDGAIWAASVDGQVHRVDPTAFEVAGKAELGDVVTAVAVGEGRVWALRTGPDASALITLDPATAAVTDNAPLGAEEPLDVAAGLGAGWIAFSDKLVALAPGDLSLIGEVPLTGADLRRVAVGDSGVWVTGGDQITRVHPGTLEITAEIVLSQEAADLAVGEGAVWVMTSDRVFQLDPTRSTVAAAITVAAPRAVSAGLGAVWVVTEHTLVRIDPELAAVSATAPTGGPPDDVVTGQGAVWVVGGEPEYRLHEVTVRN